MDRTLFSKEFMNGSLRFTFHFSQTPTIIDTIVVMPSTEQRPLTADRRQKRQLEPWNLHWPDFGL